MCIRDRALPMSPVTVTQFLQRILPERIAIEYSLLREWSMQLSMTQANNCILSIISYCCLLACFVGPSNCSLGDNYLPYCQCVKKCRLVNGLGKLQQSTSTQVVENLSYLFFHSLLSYCRSECWVFALVREELARESTVELSRRLRVRMHVPYSEHLPG